MTALSPLLAGFYMAAVPAVAVAALMVLAWLLGGGRPGGGASA